MSNFEDLSRIIELLSEADREKHEPLLRAIRDANSLQEGAKALGKDPGYAQMQLGRLRIKYLGKRPTGKRRNPLDKLGLSSNYAYKELRTLIASKKTPSVKLGALKTILETHAKLTGATVAAESVQPIVIELVSSPKELADLAAGGKYELDNKTS